jgi:hypothetical protein
MPFVHIGGIRFSTSVLMLAFAALCFYLLIEKTSTGMATGQSDWR